MRPEIIKISHERPEPSLVTYAAQQIRQGEVLGMPTDTFYGLAADPFNLRAVDRASISPVSQTWPGLRIER